MFELISNEEHL